MALMAEAPRGERQIEAGAESEQCSIAIVMKMQGGSESTTARRQQRENPSPVEALRRCPTKRRTTTRRPSKSISLGLENWSRGRDARMMMDMQPTPRNTGAQANIQRESSRGDNCHCPLLSPIAMNNKEVDLEKDIEVV